MQLCYFHSEIMMQSVFIFEIKLDPGSHSTLLVKSKNTVEMMKSESDYVKN